MKYLILFPVFLTTLGLFAQKNDALLKELEKELSRQELYVNQKQQHIGALKEKLQKDLVNGDFQGQYDSYLNLFEEYRSFKFDSAYYFLDRAKGTAKGMGNRQLLSEAKMKEGLILLSSGLFKEALDTLNNIETSLLSQKGKYEYHFTKARLYYDLADYNNDEHFRNIYIRKGNYLLDEALIYADSGTIDYWAASGLREMKQQDWQGAEKSFLFLLNNFKLSPALYAVAASSLSYVYTQSNSPDKAVKYLATAAISDIKSATKENVALRNLATELHIQGDLEKANTFVRQALDDATFYNARHRKMAISSIFPIIEGAQLYQVEQKNASLERTVILLALLALTVLIFLVIIFQQLKAKNAARKALTDYNTILQEMNHNLKETDAIKQDYIAYFIKSTSQLFNKVDHFQASTIQKIKTKKPDEVLNVVKKYSIKQERNDLYVQFDKIFLKLFPTFIEDFNNLFPEKERKALKKNELLNTEQRIFALYRLGIQDSQQTAEFLDLSVATIYSYKARAKGRSNCKDNFEEELMKIKSLH